MGKATGIILGMGALVGGYFLLSAKQVKNLIIKLGTVSKLKINLDKPSVISFTLNVTNPNGSAVVFNAFYGSCFLNGKIIATISKSDENVPLPGKGATTQINNLQAQVNAIDLIFDIIRQETTSMIITIQGTLVANGLKFPVTQSTNLSQ